MTRVIRTVVVDDEPLAREGLRVRLAREDDVEIVGEAADGPSAVDAILTLRPDLVFLDVQMPGFNGFDVVARTASSYLPTIVFVTAYDRYALRAFEVHALDYLFKPIAHRRFQEALRRARRELDRRDLRPMPPRAWTATMTHWPAWPTACVVCWTSASWRPPDPGRQVPPRTFGDSRCASRFATGSATSSFAQARSTGRRRRRTTSKLHVGSRVYQMRMTMADLERQLDPAQFTRIHRSAIVNLDRVREIRPEWHGEYEVALVTGATLRLSRGYRDRLLGG